MSEKSILRVAGRSAQAGYMDSVDRHNDVGVCGFYP